MHHDNMRKIRFLLICGSLVSPCILQGSLHFPDCNDGRVVINRVDLFKTVKAFSNLFDTFQPLQGCLTDIISCDKENGLGEIIPLGMQDTKSGEQNQPQDCADRKGLDESSIYLDHDFSPFICSSNSFKWLSHSRENIWINLMQQFRQIITKR